MKIKSLSLNYIVCTFLIIAPSTSFAQQKFDFSQFAQETEKFIVKPFSWDGNDFLTAGAVIAGTALVMQFDKSIKTEMMKDRSLENRGVMRFGTFYGDAVAPLAFGTGLLAYGLIDNNKFTKRFGYELIQSIAYSGVITSILKLTIGRERPGYSGGEFNFSPFSLKSDRFQSLPSGHATVAFAVSTVLASKFENGWLKALCYVPAVITAYSRVYNNRHWASDVFIGAFIGHYVARFVVEMHDENIIIGSDANALLSLKIKL